MKAAKRTVPAVLLLSLILSACGQPNALQTLSSGQQQELKTLTGQLADPHRSGKTKLEAAALLLNRPYPEAVEVLRGILEDSTNRSGQLAVAEAIARHDGTRKVFIDPLMALMAGKDASIRAPAGRALATYKDHGVTEKLIEIAADSERERDIRLVAIHSLGGVLEKRAVEAMVFLLDDPDENVREAVADSLTKLTNIRTFGPDPGKWKRWWERNKDKDRSEWAADLAEALGKAKSTLESENARLRDRLVRAMTDLYSAAPAAQRENMLLGFLKDSLADVRLVGAKLTYRRLAGGESVREDIRLYVRGMLGDPDPGVRAEAAMLLANLGDGGSLPALLERLEVEQVSSVRCGLVTALGQLRDPKALPAVLAETPPGDNATSAAAAAALGRIAEAHPLTEDPRAKAVEALIDRYALAANTTNGSKLREALLTAMGTVKDPAFIEVLRGSLKDRAATVRLAAVNALVRLGDTDSPEVLEPLVSDSDRGVRGAAISAIGTLGGKKYLPTILMRTDPQIEKDAAVRKQAWAVVMSMLSDADAHVLRSVADTLANRIDVPDERIRVLQLLVEAMGSDGSRTKGQAERELALALIQANRPAEAATHFARAWGLYQQADDDEALNVWDEWVAALLAGDDPAAVKAMNEQVNDSHFAEALVRLTERLLQLRSDGKHLALITLTETTLEELPHRLTAEQHLAIRRILDEGRLARKNEDHHKVGKLLGRLARGDEETRKAATVQIQAMGPRAVAPLLEELRRCVSAEKPSPETETAILAVLAKVAPDLKGYDPAAPLPEKIELIDNWVKDYQ